MKTSAKSEPSMAAIQVDAGRARSYRVCKGNDDLKTEATFSTPCSSELTRGRNRRGRLLLRVWRRLRMATRRWFLPYTTTAQLGIRRRWLDQLFRLIFSYRGEEIKEESTCVEKMGHTSSNSSGLIINQSNGQNLLSMRINVEFSMVPPISKYKMAYIFVVIIFCLFLI